MFFETLMLTMVGVAGVSEAEQKVVGMKDFDDLQGKWTAERPRYGIHTASNERNTAFLTEMVRPQNEDDALDLHSRSRATTHKLTLHANLHAIPDQEPGLEAHNAWLAKEKKARADKLKADLGQVPIADRGCTP